MKTNRFLSVLLPSAALLMGCADAELSEFPIVQIALQMSLDQISPHYEVLVQTPTGVSVEEVGVVQTYRDNNSVHSISITQIFKLDTAAPYTYTDHSRNAYATDTYTSYAYVCTSIGTYRSDAQTLVVPGINVPEIDSLRFSFDQTTGRTCTLRIFGQNFSSAPDALSLDGSGTGISTRRTRLYGYQDSIVAKNLELIAYGTHHLLLYQYGKPYPLEVEVQGPRIDSISSSNLKAGEPLTIYYSKAEPSGVYAFNTPKNKFSTSTVTLGQDEHRVELLPIIVDASFTNLTTTLVIQDKSRSIDVPTDVEFTITREPWANWGTCNGAYVRKVGNFLCSTDGKRLYGYNLETKMIEFLPRIDAYKNVLGARIHAIDDKYAYVWYWTSGTAYLSRYGLVERKWESITSLTTPATKTWFENANTLRALHDNKLFTYNLDTDTWDEPVFLYTSDNNEGMTLTEDSQMCGTYRDHYYFRQSSKFYRYPIGKPKDITYVGSTRLPITQCYPIQNDNLYFAYIGSFFMYIYQMPMTSLLEGTDEFSCIGGPEYNEPFSPNTSFVETDSHYLMIGRDGKIKALEK